MPGSPVGTHRQHKSSSVVQVFGEGNTQKSRNGDLRWAGLEVATTTRVWTQGWKPIPARTNRDSCRTGSAHQGEAEDIGAGVPEGLGEQIPDLGKEDSRIPATNNSRILYAASFRFATG